MIVGLERNLAVVGVIGGFLIVRHFVATAFWSGAPRVATDGGMWWVVQFTISLLAVVVSMVVGLLAMVAFATTQWVIEGYVGP